MHENVALKSLGMQMPMESSACTFSIFKQIMRLSMRCDCRRQLDANQNMRRHWNQISLVCFPSSMFGWRFDCVWHGDCTCFHVLVLLFLLFDARGSWSNSSQRLCFLILINRCDIYVINWSDLKEFHVQPIGRESSHSAFLPFDLQIEKLNMRMLCAHEFNVTKYLVRLGILHVCASPNYCNHNHYSRIFESRADFNWEITCCSRLLTVSVYRRLFVCVSLSFAVFFVRQEFNQFSFLNYFPSANALRTNISSHNFPIILMFGNFIVVLK